MPPYHSGERAVQTQAGVTEMANRIGKSIRSVIPPEAQAFMAAQPMAVVGTIDRDGAVWASLLTGEPGFLSTVDPQTLRIDAGLLPDDPVMENLVVHPQIGTIVIEFATRRRMRLNGKADILRTDGAIEVHADQVYSNCQKYIQVRQWQRPDPGPRSGREARQHLSLTKQQQQWIAAADTFFIASSHPVGGVDASHRGGPPGFVRILDGKRLTWPDYPGNTMFQTLGNIAENPRAGLLFIDFEQGGTLQLSGKAEIRWNSEETAELPAAERRIVFQIDRIIEIQ